MAPGDKRKDKNTWRWKWFGFGAIAVGLGLTFNGLQVLVTLDVPGNLLQWLIWAIFLSIGIATVTLGLLVLLVGGVVLWRQQIKIHHLQWVDWVLLLLISGMVACVPSLLSPLPSLLAVSADVELPIPAQSLTGGTGPLYPGAVVEIVASVPGPSGTPMPQIFTDLEVQGLYGEGDKETVLVAAPPERAQALQEALLTKDALFTYHLLSGTPTLLSGTPTPTTPPPTPTLTPSPPNGEVYLEIAAAGIQPRASTVVSGTARLVIVEKLEAALVVVEKGEEPEVKPAAVSTYAANPFCVEVVAFLDEDGGHHDRYDKDKTKNVLIQLPADQLADVARSLVGDPKIWLVNVRECTASD